jgi:hypothetical protein
MVAVLFSAKNICLMIDDEFEPKGQFYTTINKWFCSAASVKI